MCQNSALKGHKLDNHAFVVYFVEWPTLSQMFS